MTRVRADEPFDDRLRRLLAIEQGLQERVRIAEIDATRRIAEARTAGERVRTDAQRLQAHAGEAQVRADDAAQALALTSIQHQHEAVMQAIADVSDEQIDELAGRALDRALDGDGGNT